LKELAEMENRSQIDIYLDTRSQGPQPVEEPETPAAADTPDVPVLLKETKDKPPKEGQLVLGETRTIHDQDGILITARPRTGKPGMSIAVTSPQLEGILRLRDRFDKPEIVIFTIPHRNKKFYMRYGCSVAFCWVVQALALQRQHGLRHPAADEFAVFRVDFYPDCPPPPIRRRP